MIDLKKLASKTYLKISFPRKLPMTNKFFGRNVKEFASYKILHKIYIRVIYYIKYKKYGMKKNIEKKRLI